MPLPEHAREKAALTSNNFVALQSAAARLRPRHFFMNPTAAQYSKFAKLNLLFHEMNRCIIHHLQAHTRQYRKDKLVIAEYGAGPGVFTKILCKNFPSAKIIAIEQNPEYVNALKQLPRSTLKIVEDDMVHYKNSTPLDCVILKLSYHHIPDQQKPGLLRRIRRQLCVNGIIIIVDECLNSYRTDQQRKKRDQKYHHYRIRLAEKTNNTQYIQYQKDVAAQHLCPYKVSAQVIKQQLRNSGFTNIHSSLLKTTKKSIDDALLGHYCITAYMTSLNDTPCSYKKIRPR